jgi:MarR family transcriptional regulator, transcriptional regulator for hemolysin
MLKREESAGYMTNWAARLFARRIERRLKPLGISPAYLPVIFALADGSATLKRMERDRLIETKPDPADRRSVLYSLKAEARKAVEEVARAAVDTNEEALAVFDKKEREQYLAMMQRMVGRLLELEEKDGATD